MPIGECIGECAGVGSLDERTIEGSGGGNTGEYAFKPRYV